MENSSKKKRKRHFVNTAFGYFGSKNRLGKKIRKFIPPHSMWVEAFCGSAAVTLSKKPAPIEVINDIDGEIVNFFEQLRKHPDKLCEKIALTPYARLEYLLAKYDKPKNKIERARQFLIVSMMSINGMQGTDQGGFSYSDSYTRNSMEARVSRWYNLPARLVAVAERLRKVRIEKKNALTLLSFYMDRPATLVYLDPPYNTERSNGYNFDQKTEKFHRSLLSKIRKAKCMILLSGYDNELYNKELTKKRGWTKKTFSTYTKVTNGKLLKRREVLWLNRFCSIALKFKKIPIRLTRSEMHEKKVNPLRTAIKR